MQSLQVSGSDALQWPFSHLHGLGVVVCGGVVVDDRRVVVLLVT